MSGDTDVGQGNLLKAMYRKKVSFINQDLLDLHRERGNSRPPKIYLDLKVKIFRDYDCI